MPMVMGVSFYCVGVRLTIDNCFCKNAFSKQRSKSNKIIKSGQVAN